MSGYRMTLLAAVMAPALVLAQGADEPQQQQQQTQTRQPTQVGEMGKAAVSGHIRGAVTSVDYGLGQITIALGGGESMQLRGTPSQLANFKRGAIADVSYEKFGNSRWLSGGDMGELGGTFARTTTVSGAVSFVNKADGRLTLNLGTGQSATFQAHPDTIKGLVPGQFISLTYDRIASRDWVKSLGDEGSDTGR